MRSSKPQIHSLFPTPLCVHFLPVAPEMNVALRPLILARTREETSDGQGAYAGVVREVGDESLLFDFNHPLAGQPVTFEVHLIGVL